jgi:hypothetical protein
MILLCEPDKTKRKNICDLLGRERIIAIGSVQEILEMICKFRKRFKLMIINIRLLHDIIINETLFNLCNKLRINVPPVLSMYQDGDEEIMVKFKEYHAHYQLIKYVERDPYFPGRYIGAVKILYPEVISDIDSAMEAWSKKDDKRDFIDPRKWLEEEGFIEPEEQPPSRASLQGMKENLMAIDKMLSEMALSEDVEKKEIAQSNYKYLYLEFKRKYCALAKLMNDLTEYAEKL